MSRLSSPSWLPSSNDKRACVSYQFNSTWTYSRVAGHMVLAEFNESQLGVEYIPVEAQNPSDCRHLAREVAPVPIALHILHQALLAVFFLGFLHALQHPLNDVLRRSALSVVLRRHLATVPKPSVQLFRRVEYLFEDANRTFCKIIFPLQRDLSSQHPFKLRLLPVLYFKRRMILPFVRLDEFLRWIAEKIRDGKNSNVGAFCCGPAK